MIQFYLFAHGYVFLAIEFGNIANGNETRVLGVYTNRQTAQDKIHKCMERPNHSPVYEHYGIIKKTIEGRRFP